MKPSNNPSWPISREAKGRVRLLLAEIASEADRMKRAFAKVPPALLTGSEWKGATGSRRAIDRLVALMPRPPDLRRDRLVLWRFLDELPAIPGASDEFPQPCIAVRAIIAQHKKAARGTGLFGLVTTLHALHRLHDRSGFSVDAGAVVFEAHNALLALDSTEGGQIFSLDEITLPAGPGFFVGKPRIVGALQDPIVICRTWLADDQANAKRVSDATAWRSLLR